MHTDEEYTTHNHRREDNPVNTPFAIDVIRLFCKYLNVKDENGSINF